MAESERQPISERGVTWEERQMNAGADPRDLPEIVLPDGAEIPSHLDRLCMRKLLVSMINKVQPLRCIKMAHVNTLDDVIQLLRSCCGESLRSLALEFPSHTESHIICSRISIYPCLMRRISNTARSTGYVRHPFLSQELPTPPDPQATFDIHFFPKDSQHRQIHRLRSTSTSFARTPTTARSTGYVRHPFLSQGLPPPPDPQATFDIHFFRKDPQHRQIHRLCSTSISFPRTPNTARSTGYVRHPFLSQGLPTPPDPQATFDIHFFRKDPQHHQIHRLCSTSIYFARTPTTARSTGYARHPLLSQGPPTPPDPQAMFDLHFFRKDPRPFFKFVNEIYPGQFQPSAI
ncbi:hypothetical protein HPB48_020145 [Haemaphysalis longicornis]|uniref:Uncharacterized protein n=1 Tax=Haemaphysalis longicornis TaxID=44386 RepID=A0A9J6FHF6_HAELO|nr:hypothetical protein HPB48_020145 [Haemaphysalis longicornis]